MLTPTQQSVFRADVKAAADLAVAYANKDVDAIAAAYNLPSSPAVQNWRPKIEIQELNTAIVWADFVALTVAKQNGYFAMTQAPVDSTDADIRNGFTAVFGAGTASLTNLTALAQVVATRFQALFTTSGVCSLFGYALTRADVGVALYAADGTAL